jgi:hypothetical protein
VNRTNQSEFLDGKQRFATTPAAITNKIHTLANVFTELNQIVGIGGTKKIQAFRFFYGSCVAMPNK